MVEEYENRGLSPIAFVEAKHSPSLGSLATDKGGLRQGGHLYNQDRLQKYLRNAENPNSVLANKILRQYELNNVESYGAFYRSNKLYKFDFDLTSDFRYRTPDYTLVPNRIGI